MIINFVTYQNACYVLTKTDAKKTLTLQIAPLDGTVLALAHDTGLPYFGDCLLPYIELLNQTR